MTVKGANSKNSPKFDDSQRQYDAVLFMSFGGPEKNEDVIPFLENVTEGRGIPKERLAEVGEHYFHFGGKSPINDQNIALIKAIEKELEHQNLNLPVYFGNRNWDPYISDTMQQMKDDGVKRAVCFVTSGYSCYSGCRQYREDIVNAQEKVGEGAPEIDKIRVFYNHPGFIESTLLSIKESLSNWDTSDQKKVKIAFTAHSIPNSQAENSDYEVQLNETCRIITEDLNHTNYDMVYQSRSGSPRIPWLEPDILDYMDQISNEGVKDLLIVPIGFISDHMEVLYDLDTEAVEKAEELGMKMERVPTVGVSKPFVEMVIDLIKERMTKNPERKTLGERGPNHDICPVDCCKVVTGV